MATQKFTAGEVLDMLNDVQDDDLDRYKQELDQESDGAPAVGDYTDEDGQQVLVDSDLLHPNTTAVLRRINEDVLPYEMDSLLLHDAELLDEGGVDNNAYIAWL